MRNYPHGGPPGLELQVADRLLLRFYLTRKVLCMPIFGHGENVRPLLEFIKNPTDSPPREIRTPVPFWSKSRESLPRESQFGVLPSISGICRASDPPSGASWDGAR
jgi:hypothetical protein